MVPWMTAGVSDRPWKTKDILDLNDTAAPKPVVYLTNGLQIETEALPTAGAACGEWVLGYNAVPFRGAPAIVTSDSRIGAP